MADQKDKMGFPTLDIKAAKALRPNVHQIRIENILGGQSPLSGLSRSDQFLASLAIDPSNRNRITTQASGMLSPVYGTDSVTQTSGAPLWMVQNPKNSNIYVYDLNGSAYTASGSGPRVVTALSDGGSLSSSSGNGSSYNDNYIYFAKNTDIARYGPLDGSAAFDATYWTSTLSKAALTNTTYPSFQSLAGGTLSLPNHVLHRHSDGRLYISDVVGNQGTLHYISTKKTTVEGDTDNGSTQSALTFGPGLWPTAIESYGSSLAIALTESNTLGTTAKLAFWDTTSSSFNTIIFEEFPDRVITALKNVNGVLYIVSTNGQGFRLSRYVGGTTIQQIRYFEIGFPPFPGAVDGEANRLIFGSQTLAPEQCGTVYSYGLKSPAFGNGIFNIFRTSSVSGTCTALTLRATGNFHTNYPLIGWYTTIPTGPGTITEAGSSASSSATGVPLFWSQLFKIGSPFKITKIKIPLDGTLGTNNQIDPKIYMDNGTTTFSLTSITPTAFGTNRKLITLRPTSCVGDHNFYLELRWSGLAEIDVMLPITIEYELIDVDTNYP